MDFNSKNVSKIDLSKIKIDLDNIDKEQLGRIYKKAIDLGLDGSIAQAIKTATIDGVERIFVDGGQNSDEIDILKKYELKIRQLVKLDAPWKQIKYYAWASFKIKKTDKAACELVELAFLHGSIEETIDTMVLLSSYNLNYYFLIHEKIRLHIVMQLWKLEKFHILQMYLIDDSNHDNLLPLEHFFVFYFLWQKESSESKAFMYLRNRYKDIITTIDIFAPKLDINKSNLYLEMAKLAAKLEFFQVAEDLLSKLSVDEEAYAEAVRLISAIKTSNATKVNVCPLIDEMMNLADWKDRISLLETKLQLLHQKYISTNQSSEKNEQLKFFDSNIPALNEIFVDLFKYFPMLPVCWHAITKLLVKYYHLKKIIPDFSEILYINALIYHSPSLDEAIWSIVIETWHNINAKEEQYWYAVGLLHEYLYKAQGHEILLWKAKKIIKQQEAVVDNVIPYKWNELHKALYNATSKSTNFSEKKRAEMLRQLKVAADEKYLSLDEIHAYLEESKMPPMEVLNELIVIAQNKKAISLEIKILLKKILCSHATNDDLNRLWFLSVDINNNDLAWRVATILDNREVLLKTVKRFWTISGENRTEYPYINIERQDIECCLIGFPSEMKKLCKACIVVGPKVTELIDILDESVIKPFKYTRTLKGSLEESTQKALKSLNWINKKIYKNKKLFEEAFVSSEHLPYFLQLFPENPWSILILSLSEILGLNAWGWKLSKLHKKIEDILPRLANSNHLKNYSIKLAKWLKSLSAEERSAWNDMASLSSKISDEMALDYLSIFISRLTTLIYPAHHLALKTLKSMNAPIFIIWGLENWIISNEYTQIRNKYKFYVNVHILRSLKFLDSIILK